MYAIGDLVNVHICRRQEDSGDGWKLAVDHGVVMRVDGEWVSLWMPDFEERTNMNPHFTERFRNAKRVRITPSGRIGAEHIHAARSAGYALREA